MHQWLIDKNKRNIFENVAMLSIFNLVLIFLQELLSLHPSILKIYKHLDFFFLESLTQKDWLKVYGLAIKIFVQLNPEHGKSGTTLVRTKKKTTLLESLKEKTIPLITTTRLSSMPEQAGNKFHYDNLISILLIHYFVGN